MSSFSYEDVSRDKAGSPLTAVATTLRSLALAAGLALVGVSGALAQESTPEAKSSSVECVAPEEAAPEAEIVASPEAETGGSPAAGAESTGEGTPADEALTAEVAAAVENYTACYNSGDIAALLALTTPAYLVEAYGTDDVATLEGALAMAPLPAMQILSLANVQTYDDGRVSIDGEYMSGDHQYLKARTFFVQAGDSFLIDREDYLPSTAEAEEMAIISFTIADDTSPLAFDESTSVPAIEGLTLYGANNGAERHTVAILRLSDEAAGTPVAEMPVEQIMGGELVGALIIEAGERGELVLLNLPPGNYLLVDALVPGSAATLTVTEPAPES